MVKIWQNRSLTVLHVRTFVVLTLVFLIAGSYISNRHINLPLDSKPAIEGRVLSPSINRNYENLVADLGGIERINQTHVFSYLHHTERISVSDDKMVEGVVLYLNDYLWKQYFNNSPQPYMYSFQYTNFTAFGEMDLYEEDRSINGSKFISLETLPQELDDILGTSTAVILFPMTNEHRQHSLTSVRWNFEIGLYFDTTFSGYDNEEFRQEISRLENQFKTIAQTYGEVHDIHSPLYNYHMRTFSHYTEAIRGIINPIILLLFLIDFIAYSSVHDEIQQMNRRYQLLFQRGYSHKDLMLSFFKWNSFWIIGSGLGAYVVGKLFISDLIQWLLTYWLIGMFLFKISFTWYIIIRNFRKFRIARLSSTSLTTSISEFAQSHTLGKLLVGFLLIKIFQEGRIGIKRGFIWDGGIFERLLFRNSDLDTIILVFLMVVLYFASSWSLRTKLDYHNLENSLQNISFKKNLDVVFVPLVLLADFVRKLTFVEIRKYIEGENFYNSLIPILLPFNKYYLVIIIGSALFIALCFQQIFWDKEYQETTQILSQKYLGDLVLPSSIMLVLRIGLMLVVSIIVGFASGMVMAFNLWKDRVYAYPTSPEAFSIYYFILGLVAISSVVVYLCIWALQKRDNFTLKA